MSHSGRLQIKRVNWILAVIFYSSSVAIDDYIIRSFNATVSMGAAMKTHAVILCFVIGLAAPLFARDSTDVVIMNNGDRLTGTIKGLDAGTLYFSLPYVVQTLSVDWSKVAQLQSQQWFLVKMQDGSVYTGIVNTAATPAGAPMKLEVVDPEGKQILLDRDQVVQVGQTSERFLKRFTGGVDLGLSYSKGNQTTQYNLSGLAAYPRERWAAQLGFNSVLSSSSGSTVSTRNQATLTAFHLLPWNHYFYGGLGSFLQSAEQGIQQQYTFGGGIGRYLKNTNRTVISVLGGGAYQVTAYRQSTVPIGTQNVAAALIAANVNLFRFNKTSLNVNAVLLPALSEPGRVYFTTNASYHIKITGNLSWNISFYGSWDTRPPGGLPGSDYGTSSGLSWTFGSSLRTTPRSSP
jgi:putative salt-induced outer membrane protein YdiY